MNFALLPVCVLLQYVVDVTGEQDAMMLTLEQDDSHAGKNMDNELQTIGLMIFKVCSYNTVIPAFTGLLCKIV